MSIVNVLEEKLNAIGGESEIIFLPMLVKAGICGSTTSAKKMLKSSGIQSIRIGNRTLFAKQDVVTFLRKHASSDVQE